MKINIFIATLTILSCTVQAQDSTVFYNEQQQLLLGNLKNHYQLPALNGYVKQLNFTSMQMGYSHQKSDAYILQRGSGNSGFQIQVDSYQKKNKNMNLWGSFNYSNQKIHDVNFNESLDFDKVYPYVTTDTIGGDIAQEQYAIMGGFSKTLGTMTYAFESAFTGKQDTRNRDPRINNISTDFLVNLSASRALTANYAMGLSIQGSRYMQKNKVSFNSEMGKPTLYHETGIGTYNRLFMGTLDEANYLGHTYALKLQLAPKEQLGWFAHVDYQQTKLTKNLKDISHVINTANKQQVDLALGYKTQLSTNGFLAAGATYQNKHIAGIEGKFDNREANVNLTLIAEEQLFSAIRNESQAYLSYQQLGTKDHFSTTLRMGYSDFVETYKAPLRQQEFTHLTMHGQVVWARVLPKNFISASLGYTYVNPLSANFYWGDLSEMSLRQQMLRNNYDYYNTAWSKIDFNSKYTIALKKAQKLFFGFRASYVEAYKLQEFTLSTGFVF